MRRRRSTVRVSRLCDAAGQQLRVLRFANDDFGFGTLLGKHPSDALERSAGSVARNPVIQPLSGEVVQYLARRRARVNIGIGFIFKLPGHEPAMRLGKLDGLVDHADGALGGGRDNHLCAKEPHQLAPFDAERLCHGNHKRISFGRANHGKTNSGISAGRLDDGLAGLELSGLFGRLDHPERQSVLYRTKRIEGFNLDEKVHAFRRQTIDPHHRRIADCFDNTLVCPSHAVLQHLNCLPQDALRPAATFVLIRSYPASALPAIKARGGITAPSVGTAIMRAKNPAYPGRMSRSRTLYLAKAPPML